MTKQEEVEKAEAEAKEAFKAAHNAVDEMAMKSVTFALARLALYEEIRLTELARIARVACGEETP